MPLRILIVDDEPLARERILHCLKGEPDVEVVGECGDGPSAVEAIENLHPDLVFLDIQMPGMDGLGVCEAVGAEAMPDLVFVTAYDQYALKAFEVRALDYLLKPFDRDRFREALDRARARCGTQEGAHLAEELRGLLEELRGTRKENAYPERLMVKVEGRMVVISVSDLDWVESAGNYICLHIGRETHILRETLSGFETKLDSRKFARIHRSTIVNLDRVKEMSPFFHGDYQIVLRDGTQLTLSRNYREPFMQAAGHLA